MTISPKHHIFKVQGKVRKKEKMSLGSAWWIVASKSIIQIIKQSDKGENYPIFRKQILDLAYFILFLVYYDYYTGIVNPLSYQHLDIVIQMRHWLGQYVIPAMLPFFVVFLFFEILFWLYFSEWCHFDRI